MTSWRKEITEAMDHNNDSLSCVVDTIVGELDQRILLDEKTSKDTWLDREFDEDYGMPEGHTFIIWTLNWIYFPVTYDGKEWVSSVPRNPLSSYHPGHFGASHG